MTSYRYPNEHLILAATLALVLVVIGVTATATLCGSGIFLIAALVYGASASRTHHQALISGAIPVAAHTAPQLDRLVQTCARRLRPSSIEVYVAPNDELNAYTFGLEDPKVIVLYDALLRVMDGDELTFIIGHEMGHVVLGHTWLNSLVGGLAGIPASLGSAAVLTLALRSWNRACEYSADRAGLLACGDIEKATTALVKLEAGPGAFDAAALGRAYRQIDAQDDTLTGVLNENLATHPLLIRRIQALRSWAAGAEYARWHTRLTAESGI